MDRFVAIEEIEIERERGGERELSIHPLDFAWC